MTKRRILDLGDRVKHRLRGDPEPFKRKPKPPTKSRILDLGDGVKLTLRGDPEPFKRKPKAPMPPMPPLPKNSTTNTEPLQLYISHELMAMLDYADELAHWGRTTLIRRALTLGLMVGVKAIQDGTPAWQAFDPLRKAGKDPTTANPLFYHEGPMVPVNPYPIAMQDMPGLSDDSPRPRRKAKRRVKP